MSKPWDGLPEPERRAVFEDAAVRVLRQAYVDGLLTLDGAEELGVLLGVSERLLRELHAFEVERQRSSER